jgi:Na+-transporting methylmalonyl-CoA/oxaloacetate decarboxylase gamma subunit
MILRFTFFLSFLLYFIPIYSKFLDYQITHARWIAQTKTCLTAAQDRKGLTQVVIACSMQHEAVTKAGNENSVLTELRVTRAS